MPDTSEQIKTTPRGKKWLRRSAYSGLFLTVIAVVAYFSLPPIAGWQIETQLERLGARSVKMEGLSINPATGEISVERFASIGPDGEDISVGAATLRISLSALARRRVTIQKLTVADADIDIRLDARGQWSVGGFPMSFADDKSEPASDDPWQLKAGNIAIDNSRMTLAIGNTIQTALVEKLRIDILSTLRPNEPTVVHLSARTAGGTLRVDGQAYPFANRPNVAVAIKLSDYDLKVFENLIAKGRLKSIAGTAAIEGELTAGATTTGGAAINYTGALSASNLATQTKLFAARSTLLSWNGRARIEIASPSSTNETLPGIRINGIAAAKSFGFENRITNMTLAAQSSRFDFSKSGMEIRAMPSNKDVTEIYGGVIAQLGQPVLEHPETGLKIAPQQIDIQGGIRLNLPPRTAAFSARLSGTLGADNLVGAMKSAGVDALAASKMRLAYSDAILNLDAKGGISAMAAAKLDITGLRLDAPKLGVNTTIARLGSNGQKIAFVRTGEGALSLTMDGRYSAEDVIAKDGAGRWESIQKKLVWLGKIGLGSGETGSAASNTLSVSGDATAAGLSATLLGKDGYSVSLDDALLKGISIDKGDSRIATATLSGINASAATKGSALSSMRLKSLRLSGASATGENRLTLKSVDASGLNGRIVRTGNGAIVLPGGSTEAITPQTSITAQSRDNSGSIQVERATLTDSAISFTDRSTEPVFSIETSRFQASLKDLDTARPDSDTAFDILVGLGNFGRIDARGSFKPVFDRVTADIAVGFKNIEMFKFNAYVAPAINHTVRQGRVDGRIEIALRNSAIKASTSLILNRLKVKPVAAPVGTLNGGGKPATGGPPMETAINLLENDKGVINLSIPISGSLDDPKFDLSNAIGQAVAGAIQKTLLTAIKIAFPLGTVVAIVDAVGNSKIEIKPLAFASGTSRITPELKNRIAEIATYLRKKPDAAPSICGPATTADLAVLQKQNPKADKAVAIKAATNRMINIREELVTKRGIDPKRLFLCDPEFFDEADGKSLVTIGLKE